MKTRLYSLFLLSMLLTLYFTGCSANMPDAGSTLTPVIEQADSAREEAVPPDTADNAETATISENGEYFSTEDVAEYIHIYGRLPCNYITKEEAMDAGWDSSKGNLWDVAEGKSIGGDRFGNREGRLPKADGRKWYECDVNYSGGYRGAERILFSNDGLIYYTGDHYETFTQLY